MRVQHATLHSQPYMDEDLVDLIVHCLHHYRNVPYDAIDLPTLTSQVLEAEQDHSLLATIADFLLTHVTDHIVFDNGLSFHVSTHGKLTTKRGTH